jgi:hypothetical protein
VPVSCRDAALWAATRLQRHYGPGEGDKDATLGQVGARAGPCTGAPETRVVRDIVRVLASPSTYSFAVIDVRLQATGRRHHSPMIIAPRRANTGCLPWHYTTRPATTTLTSSASIVPTATRPLPSIACIAYVSFSATCAFYCPCIILHACLPHFARLNARYTTRRLSHPSATDLFNCSAVECCRVSPTHTDPQRALRHIAASSSYINTDDPRLDSYTPPTPVSIPLAFVWSLLRLCIGTPHNIPPRPTHTYIFLGIFLL